MRSDSQTYETVARHCSSFTPVNTNDSYSNAVTDSPERVSCVNCRHFTSEKYCELDLYDQIVANRKL